jgi:hypothetical protein
LLTTIPRETLRDCGYLMTLNLCGNPVRQVAGDAFTNMPGGMGM